MRLNSRATLPFFVFLSLLLTLVIYWWGYDKPTYGIDDANIYFVYMRHLAQGHGLRMEYRQRKGRERLHFPALGP